MEEAATFFKDFLGKQPQHFYALPQSGSARKNFVGEDGMKKYIITSNANIAENESFFYFSSIFSELNLNSPNIYKISEDRTMYIQEFLGNQTLSELIETEGLSEKVKSLVKQTLEKLFELQKKTENSIDYSKTFEYEKYDELPISNDLFYFKNFIADVLEIPYHKASLLKEFKQLISKIEKTAPQVLMIRDFQARNIMVNEDQIFFIDYQSAMQGPAMYDVISFLFQAKANFPEDFKEEMLNYYFSLWKDEETVSKLKSSFKPIQLIRFLQVLGAYGFRGLIQRKPHFLASLSKGIENVYQFTQHWDEMSNYPELTKIIVALESSAIQTKIKSVSNH